MTNASSDNRRHRRFAVDVQAVLETQNGPRLAVRTRDLSCSGICLIADAPLSPGERLQVELVLDFGNNSFSEPLRLDAHVVWCTPIAQAFQVGAMFDGLTEEQDSYIEMFLHFLDGTLSPKGVGPEAGGDGQGENGDSSPDDKDDPFRR